MSPSFVASASKRANPFAEQKAPIIERAYPADHGAKALREASHDLRQRHRLERNDAQFIQGLGISKAATLREATRAVTNCREAVERQRQELIALNRLITDAANSVIPLSAAPP